MNATSDDPEAAAHAYFRVLEDEFLRLRTAPTLLSPADWQLAEGWHRAGIPIDLVVATLRDVWKRRLERGASARRIQSLRYFAPAVEAAWEEVRSLQAPGVRSNVPAIDLPSSLAALAALLPEGFSEVARWRDRIRALDGEARLVEEQLAHLEAEIGDVAWRDLSPEERAAVEALVTRRLAPLANRLTAEQRAESALRLRRSVVRARVGLPLLSLFSTAIGAPEESPAD
jgi:hypothetical protein